MTGLATVVAASASASSAQAQRGAVSLDMAEALAVIALLGLGGARERAAIRLVAYIGAVSMAIILLPRTENFSIPGCLPVY